jgi:uncharacterized protein
MTALGRVIEIWRYPVSSVGGERLDRASVGAHGVEGDRRFALFEAETGLAAAPERDVRWRPALFLTASYAGEDMPMLTFPQGEALRVDDRRLSARLSAHFGFDVAIGTYGTPDGHDKRMPVVSPRYEPAGLHVVTTASVGHLSALSGVGSVEVRRFRPTLLIDSGAADSFLENDWIGREVAVGTVRAQVTDATRRCGMTLVAQPGLSEEPAILRTIMRRNARNLGVYARVLAGGTLAVSDPVHAGI